jgi:hypothetical protein
LGTQATRRTEKGTLSAANEQITCTKQDKHLHKQITRSIVNVGSLVTDHVDMELMSAAEVSCTQPRAVALLYQ